MTCEIHEFITITLTVDARSSTSIPTSVIRVKLNKKESFRSDVCLVEGSITIGDLSDRCQGSQGLTTLFVRYSRTD